MADETNVTNNNLYPLVPNFLPSVVTQLILSEVTQHKDRIYYYTERRVLTDLLVQHDIGSAQQISGPKNLFCVHQSQIRSNTPNKNNNIAVFDNLDLRKFFIEKDGQRYLRGRSLRNSEETDYIEQYKDSKLFLKNI